MPTSVSALLASAASRRQKIQDNEDALVDFEYSLSNKTYADFVAYQSFLQDRANKASDPSKQLSYQKAIVGARKGYISNEIQRANIDIIEGRGNNQTKYQKMVDLYYQALNNGDYDQAQTLNLQLDNLSVKIQQEQQAAQESAQRVASTLAQNGVKTLKQLSNKVKNGTEEITLSDGRIIAPIKAINEELKTGNYKDYFAMLYDTTSALRGLAIDTYNGATDQDTIDAIQNDSFLSSLIDGSAKFATAAGTDGNTKQLGMDDIELAYRSAAANNPIYSVSKFLDERTGQQRYGLKENKIDDFVWTRDDDGNYRATQARDQVQSPYQTLDTQITDDGHIIAKGSEKGKGTVNTGKIDKNGNFKAESANTDDGLSIKNRLKMMGIVGTGKGGDIKQNSDGTLDLILPGQGFVKGTIMPNGSIRYFGAPGNYSGANAGLYEINLVGGQEYVDAATGQKTGGKGSTREVAPDEASDFGNESVFGGLLSQPSAQGRNYIKNLSGLSEIKELTPVDFRRANITQIGAKPLLGAPGGIGVANDFSGNAHPVLTKLLQGGSFTQGNIQRERAEAIRQQALREQTERLQAASVYNLNQTPVRQTASNGAPVRQLTVAKPKAQPKVVVVRAPTRGTGQLGGFTGGFVDKNSGFRLQ